MLRRIFLVSLFSGLVATAAERVVVGSDLLAPALEDAITAGALPDSQLALTGSRSGLDELRAGKADLAVVTFAPDENLPDKEFRLVPLGYQVAVFVVTATNPIERLSFSQLGGIFGEKEPTNHRQWGSLGGKGVWELKSISVKLVDDPGSLAVDLFTATVLHSPTLKRTIRIGTDRDEMLRSARVDDTCILFLPCPLAESDGVKILPVAKRDDDVAFGPTPENIYAGDYPLRLPFYLAFKPEKTHELESTLRDVLGAGVAEALARHGFMPAPANVRGEAAASLAAR